MIDVNKKIMESMKAHDKVASETFKLLKAKILEFKTAKNAREYNDSEEITLINKMISDRMNSATIYLENDRKDLADAEYAQAKVLQDLLPSLPTKEDIDMYLDSNYPNGVDKKQMGMVVKEIKSNLLGADGKMVADSVRERIL